MLSHTQIHSKEIKGHIFHIVVARILLTNIVLDKMRTQTHRKEIKGNTVGT